MLNLMTNTQEHPSFFDNVSDHVPIGQNNVTLCESRLNHVISLLIHKIQQTRESPTSRTSTLQALDHITNTCLKISHLSPLSIVLIEINNFDQISSLFDSKKIQQSNVIISDSLLRSLDDTTKSLIDYENGLYVILSQKTSLSSITRTIDSFLKSIKGLTIPYPRKSVYSVLNVNIGIGYFSELVDNQSLENLFTIAGAALKQSRMTGGVVINTG